MILVLSCATLGRRGFRLITLLHLGRRLVPPRRGEGGSGLSGSKPVSTSLSNKVAYQYLPSIQAGKQITSHQGWRYNEAVNLHLVIPGFEIFLTGQDKAPSNLFPPKTGRNSGEGANENIGSSRRQEKWRKDRHHSIANAGEYYCGADDRCSF